MRTREGMTIEELAARTSAGQYVFDLSSALGSIEELAQSDEGRQALADDAADLIECQRRLYALMWALSLVVKAA